MRTEYEEHASCVTMIQHFVCFLFQLTASVLGAVWVTSRFSYAWGYYTGGEAEDGIISRKTCNLDMCVTKIFILLLAFEHFNAFCVSVIYRTELSHLA